MSFSDRPNDSGPSAAGKLAQLSVWLPLGVIIFTGYLHRFGGSHALPQWAMALLGFGVVIVALGGFACGIAALCRRSEGDSTVTGRSIAGLALSSFLMILFFVGFTNGFTRAIKARQTMASFSQSLREANADVRRSFDSTNGIKPNPALFDKAITAAKQASQELPGESGLVMEASAAYLTELQRLSKAYDAEFTRLQKAQILSTSNLTNKNQIQSRKAIVGHFLQVNDDMDRFVGGSESAFKTEMTKRNVSEARIRNETEAFRRSFQTRAPLVREIRASDKSIGGGMLDVLNLLESEWGRWRYDAPSEKVIFSDTATLTKYNNYLDQISNSARQEVALQKRLLDIQPGPAGGSSRSTIQ